ncbi:hypothetical protein ALC57_02530 [Trachymyrmex cornetzi]|uniref:Uncharacterized protein n=1 Tax=Trachymyrmex cornetzi TaxID=471704 RepID=A0A195EJN9_9HYME|nr:hypothetical protein ALC57_02530 [Trachymyrmex cornetzi]
MPQSRYKSVDCKRRFVVGLTAKEKRATFGGDTKAGDGTRIRDATGLHCELINHIALYLAADDAKLFNSLPSLEMEWEGD